ncbi:uncharacterized protein [Ptychodera flava]|uniref:uncharacterized protein n=1 Tax=Ptychodera flava TaxID=63121 RepID=UPI00396A1588
MIAVIALIEKIPKLSRQDAVQQMMSQGSPMEDAFRQHLLRRVVTSTPNSNESTSTTPDVAMETDDECSLHLQWSGSGSDSSEVESVLSDTDNCAGVGENRGDESSTSEEEDGDEVWEEENEDDLDRDLGQPLPIVSHRSKLGKVND